MSLVDDVTAQMKEAMKAKDKVRLGALRNVRAAFLEALKQPGVEELGDEEAIGILRKLAKSHGESIAAYEQGGREDLLEAEKAQLAVVEGFLPSLADEAQVRAWAKQAIDDTGASSMSDMGKVMGKLMGEHGHEVDGKLAQTIVKDELAG
jgi:uncharacterized protein YqeY